MADQTQAQDRAVALTGWRVKIPPPFSSPAPITIVARERCQTLWNNFVEDGSSTSNPRAWRSAATALTGEETGALSSDEATRSYKLIGFVYPRLDIDIANKEPDNMDNTTIISNNSNNKSERPSIPAELGLVVAALDDIRKTWCQVYLLLDMKNGLCTPYGCDPRVVFYLPRFRVNIDETSLPRRDNQKAGSRLWDIFLSYDDSDSDSDDYDYDENGIEVIRGCSRRDSNEKSPLLVRVEEIPYGDVPLSVGVEKPTSKAKVVHFDDNESSSDEGMSIPNTMDIDESSDEESSLFVSSGESADEEEELMELVRDPSEEAQVQTPNPNDMGDSDTSPASIPSFTDQLCRMTALCKTTEEIQSIDRTLRLELVWNLPQAAQERSAMRKFVDLSKDWERNDSHAFCVEMSACGQLEKAPRMSEVTRIRIALAALKADLGYEWLGRFFKFTTVLLKDEQKKPIPQDTVNYAVLKSLELVATLTQGI
ncbi:hypothetical protein PG997_002008 [Apiospora hydei]|uniref:Uncharacterized protein n=1 Tax=Apiospora hydei TaxID=1337664 RepID=A0ABR1X864_9PEZI